MSNKVSRPPSDSAKSSQTPTQDVRTRLLKLPQVLEKIPVSKTEWYRRVKSGAAPQPIALGVRAVAWRECDIDTYINSLSSGVSK